MTLRITVQSKYHSLLCTKCTLVFKACVFTVALLLCVQTQRLQRELRAEHDLTQRELQESSRRLQQDCDHRVALERDKVRLMEEERGRLLQQVETETQRNRGVLFVLQ